MDPERMPHGTLAYAYAGAFHPSPIPPPFLPPPEWQIRAREGVTAPLDTSHSGVV